VNYSYVDINTGVKAGRDVDIKIENPQQQNPQDVAERLKKAMDGDDAPVVVPPVVAASAPKPVPIEVCNRYIPAKPIAIPKMSERQIEEASKATLEKYNEILLTQIQLMYQHSRKVQSAQAEALNNHLKTCRTVVVQ